MNINNGTNYLGENIKNASKLNPKQNAINTTEKKKNISIFSRNPNDIQDLSYDNNEKK